MGKKPKRISGKEFVKMIKTHGVRIVMTPAGLKSKEFCELAGLIFLMKDNQIGRREKRAGA